MTDTERQIRETAKQLLKEGRVDLIIGYGRGTLPLRSVPLFVRTPEEAEGLIWDATCENSLAKFLMRRRGQRVGIVARGCDLRAVVEGIKERQLARENVYSIGVGCRGLVDRAKVERHLAGKEIGEAVVRDDLILIRGDGYEEKLMLSDFLDGSCAVCRYPNPLLSDVFVGERVPQPRSEGEFRIVEEMERLSPAERWARISGELSRCIRCYACREACPLCYCPECFASCTMPSWVGKSMDPSDTMLYHIVRALHLAGRCVDCGACSRACPMNIDLRPMNKKLEKEVRTRFGYDSGVNLEETSVMGSYRAEDAQEFIM
jgi:ferredoxin